MSEMQTSRDLAAIIRDVPDFPRPGILFKDITPLLGNPAAFRRAVDLLAERLREVEASHVVAVEARGYVLGAPVAYKLGLGFVPVRKPGKLPYRTVAEDYQLEYGTNTLEIHVDAVGKGDRVLVVDDLIATGGSARAAARLVEKLGARIAAFGFLVELSFLEGRRLLEGYPVYSLITF